MIDALGDLGNLAASGLAGGVLGVVGSVVSSGTKLWTKRQDNAHALKQRAADLREIEAEAASAEKRTALELEGRRDVAASELRAASYVESQTRWTEGLELSHWWERLPLVFVDLVRGVTRPVLTGYVLHRAAPALTPEVWAFLASTTVTWWFGDRAMAAAAGAKK